MTSTNPYVPPLAERGDTYWNQDGQQIQRTLRRLKWLREVFGFTGFLMPLAVTWWAERAYLDVFAVAVGIIGSRLSVSSFRPVWKRVFFLAGIALMWPARIPYESAIRSNELLSFDCWLALNRTDHGNPLPMLLVLVQSVLAIVIAVTAARFPWINEVPFRKRKADQADSAE